MATDLVRPDASRRAPAGRRRGIRLTRTVVGCFYLFTGGVHVGIVAADPGFYRHFADGALFGFVGSLWRDVFMAHPAAWGLVLAAGEIAWACSCYAGAAGRGSAGRAFSSSTWR